MPGMVRLGDMISCGDVVAMGSSNVFAEGLPATRMGPDLTLGHCHLPTAFSAGASTVFINGLPSVRLGDAIIPHVCPPTGIVHGGNAIIASVSVQVESGGGAGAVIDNNPIFATSGIEIPPNVNPTPGDDVTSADVYTYLNNDIPDEINSPPPLTVTHELIVAEEDDAEPQPTTQPTYDSSAIEALHPNFNWATVKKPFPNDHLFEYLSFVDFAINIQLSPSYTLLDLCYTAVSHYEFSDTVIQLCGLSQKQILLNLCHHCNVVLEPLKQQYPNMVITSGFRNKAGNSQHNKGQATDIQFINIHSAPNTGDIYFARAQNVRDVIDYDQLILEWYGKNPWFHLSSNTTGHRNKVLTQTSHNGYGNGLKLLRHN